MVHETLSAGLQFPAGKIQTSLSWSNVTHVIQIYLSQLNQCLHITVAVQNASPFAAILASVRLIVSAKPGRCRFKLEAIQASSLLFDASCGMIHRDMDEKSFCQKDKLVLLLLLTIFQFNVCFSLPNWYRLYPGYSNFLGGYRK